MAQDEASYQFPEFLVRVKFVGDEVNAAYQTAIEVPGFEPAYGGVILKGDPVFAAAADEAVIQFQQLLVGGIQPFLEDFRQTPEGRSFKAVQNMRLVLLTWLDMAQKIGAPALQAAEAYLKAQEAVEYRATYGKEQKAQKASDLEIPVDVQYDLGSVVMDMRVMGIIEGFPLWHITALVPETDLHASSLIGAESPFALPIAQLMVDNLEAVLRQGVERYLKEDPRATRTPVNPEKRKATEDLYAVASYIGPEGVARADQVVKDMIQEKLDTLEGEALQAMEATIAEYRKRKPKA